CFQAEDGIRGFHVTGVQTCALPIFRGQLTSWVTSLARPKSPPGVTLSVSGAGHAGGEVLVSGRVAGLGRTPPGAEPLGLRRAGRGEWVPSFEGQVPVVGESSVPEIGR